MTDPLQPHDEEPARRRVPQRVKVFAPILLVVVVVLIALDMPWQIVAVAVGAFIVWLLVEG